MNSEKNEIRDGIYREVGVYVENELEKAEADVHAERGAAHYLREQALKMGSILAAVDTAMNTGSSDAPADLEAARVVKLWISKCILAVKNASDSCHNRDLLGQGKVAQLRDHHDWVSRTRNMIHLKELRAEEEKINNPDVIKDSDGDPVYVGDGAAPPGVRKGNKEDRLNFEQAKTVVIPAIELVGIIEGSGASIKSKAKPKKKNAYSR